MECHDILFLTQRPIPDHIKKILSGYRISQSTSADDALNARVTILAGFRKLDRGFFGKTGNTGCLRLVITASSGYDHIDTGAAADAGVCVANQPEAIAEAVAEYAVAGILAVARRLVEGRDYVLSGDWARQGWPRHLPGMLIRGRCLGVIGAGRIGSRIAFVMRALGASRILYYNRSPRPALESHLGAERASLERIFSECDIIVNSLPYSPSTDSIITYELLSRVKLNAIFVNVGRGGTVEEGAIERLVRERPDVGLVLDVYRREPLDPESVIAAEARKRGNIILTPHFAGYSRESSEATLLLAALQAKDYIEKGCVWNPVNGACNRCSWGAPSIDDILGVARTGRGSLW